MAEARGVNGRSICLVAGLFTGTLSSTAQSADCFPGPDFQPPAGSRWQYQRDSATNKGCWHVEELTARRTSRTPTRSSHSNVKKAMEAVGDEDVVTPPAGPKEDREQVLYEEFVRSRLREIGLKQLET